MQTLLVRLPRLRRNASPVKDEVLQKSPRIRKVRGSLERN